MTQISQIGNLLKKMHRLYSGDLLQRLQEKGYTDLRPSFLEILIFISEKEGPSIKDIGQNCGLKKQTMTSHLNELVKRNYIQKKSGEMDKREQRIFLTEYGTKFRISMLEAMAEQEKNYTNQLGEVEINRMKLTLEEMFAKISDL